MPKAERIEDLGEIRVRLEYAIDRLDEDWGNLLSSKHSFEEFYKNIAEEDKADDLHRTLRYHLELLNEILFIARGLEE